MSQHDGDVVRELMRMQKSRIGPVPYSEWQKKLNLPDEEEIMGGLQNQHNQDAPPGLRGPSGKDQAQPEHDGADSESSFGEEDVNEVEIEEMALVLDELCLGKKDCGNTQKILDDMKNMSRKDIIQNTRTVWFVRPQMDQCRNTNE